MQPAAHADRFPTKPSSTFPLFQNRAIGVFFVPLPLLLLLLLLQLLLLVLVQHTITAAIAAIAATFPTTVATVPSQSAVPLQVLARPVR